MTWATTCRSVLPSRDCKERLYCVPSSREFAAEARSLGLPVHAIEGDITDVWFHDFSLRRKQEPVAIAGLTAHGPLFCLERLAWGSAMHEWPGRARPCPTRRRRSPG